MCVYARARPLCSASCFLMQHRTASPGLLGDLVMFFFPSFLSSQETRTNCRAVAIGAGRFVFSPTFIPGTSPSTVTVETRATPTLFPSVSLPSMIYCCFLFLIYHTAPAYQHFSGQSSISKNSGTSLKRICLKATMKKCRSMPERSLYTGT